jgi:hypothetical protein
MLLYADLLAAAEEAAPAENVATTLVMLPAALKQSCL